MQLISFGTATVFTTAFGRIGEEALCYVENTGLLSGVIVAVIQPGFCVELDLSEERRARLAARLTWHVDTIGGLIERRESEQIIPTHRSVAVRVPHGPVLRGVIQTLSRTRAVIRLDDPAARARGAVVIVGKRYATVLWSADGSITVRFRLPFTAETFHADVLV